MLGALSGVFSTLLGISGLAHIDDLFLVWALVGSGLALTRALPVLRGVTICLALATGVVGYSPLTTILMHSLLREDQVYSADAIVVLSSLTQSDGSLSGHASERAIQAYKLLQRGCSNRLVMSDSTLRFGSQVPAVRTEMTQLGLQYDFESSGPAADTHDEAVGTARLFRQHGWKTAILVTQPWHMKRAAAVFEKAGLKVMCSPCIEGAYDINSLDTAAGRLTAFRDWLHEAVGYEVYRRRGWIK